MRHDRPVEPWFSFLAELDAELNEPFDLHCVGGFMVSQHNGCARETADLDILNIIPRQLGESIVELAGRGSALHKKCRVYIDRVGVTNYPDSYEDRLVATFPVWENICLWGWSLMIWR